MAALLDTYTLLWWCQDNPALSLSTRAAIAEQDCFVSLVSFWEIAIKVSLNKMTVPGVRDLYMAEQMSLNGFDQLAISFRQIMRCASLPRHHGDPFDRLMVAQAQEEKLTIISCDPAFDTYGIPRVW